MDKILEQLKINSDGKLKEYHQPIREDQFATIGDLKCSYVIEGGLLKQKVLTISHKDGIAFEATEDLDRSIRNVFGVESMIFRRVYPNRGFCLQYVWGT